MVVRTSCRTSCCLPTSWCCVSMVHFLFGATEKLSEATVDVDSLPAVVILRLRNMTAIDATGLHELERLSERLRATGRTLLLCGARSQPDQLLRQSDFL